MSRLAEYAVNAEQIEREKELKLKEIQTAKEKVEWYAEKYDWSPEDTDTVLQVLGLIESPPPLKLLSRR